MILVTGGVGYIGAHICVELLSNGSGVLILDNLCNSSRITVERITVLAGARPGFIEGDVRNRPLLERLFTEYPIDAVVHCAGLKAVGESVREPLRYFETNVSGSVNLCQAMANADVHTLLFSSSATVYGECAQMPIDESCVLGQPTSPYGHSKLMAENVMESIARSDPRWSVGLLRYFNPIGAHPSGLLGEAPMTVPNNLLPYLLQVATGQQKELSIFGGDYPTPDGTGVRDYIHVMDLAEGHLRALGYLQRNTGVHTWNLGTGRGYSVLEMVNAFERISGMTIPLKTTPRRNGDIAQCWADPGKAARELGWRATRNLDEMLKDAWRWQCQNPHGYEVDKLVS